MKIKVVVKTGAKASNVVSEANGVYAVSVKSPAKQGRANTELIKLLADYFGITRSSVSIISGLKSKHKVINIS
ncbi:MAG: DUF167 domain-containing protein [Candidatus Colwellbacteria bacterium]|nr:DUF167 domain-containing protein [Candidatus Colwellbacteria bacterium]